MGGKEGFKNFKIPRDYILNTLASNRDTLAIRIPKEK